jgi:hypothetical protein
MGGAGVGSCESCCDMPVPQTLFRKGSTMKVRAGPSGFARGANQD